MRREGESKEEEEEGGRRIRNKSKDFMEDTLI